jgi:hypothetical protein
VTILVGSGVLPLAAGAGTASTTASAVPAAKNRALLTLLERQTAVYQAEAAQSGADIIPYAESLPGLQAAVTRMHKEVKRISSQVAAAKKLAVEAAVNQYIAGVVPATNNMFKALTVTPRQASAQVYRDVVVSTALGAVTNYQKLKKRATKTQALVQARLNVINTTIPDLYLNSLRLTSEADVSNIKAQSVAQALGVPLRVNALTALAIVAPSTLTAAQMAAWWSSTGDTNNTGVGILELAQEYLKAGKAEGVAGDVAFAQSMLETGGFSIMSGRNNFAGIGACNSCNGGYNYSSYVQGIRAQIQLLHAYADAKLTNAKLVGGAAYQGVNTLSVRGCCQSWPELSAVWATGTHYGDIILGIYSEMLSYAINHP